MKVFKQIVKKYFPVSIKIMSHLRRKQRFINYFNSNFNKNALLSYVTWPFYKRNEVNRYRHTNYYEAKSWVDILNKLKYNIDIIPYDYIGKIDFTRYELLCGFGDCFQKYYESGLNHLKTIYYATGMHVCHQNNITLKRINDVYKRKGVWLAKSARFVEKTWTHQTMLVDGIIALGDEICKESYSKFYNGLIFNIPAPIYNVIDGHEILSQKTINSGKVFLWFGGPGLVHKGLDLVLEFFANKPELKLHVCGPIKDEQDFEKMYFKELYQTPNIVAHGFVDIFSEHFKEIMKESSFIVFPSCSEGGCPSVLVAVGNGALIPIVTKETTMSTGFEIVIDDFTVDGVRRAVDKALMLDKKEILDLQRKNLEYVLKYNSQDNYYLELKNAICKLLSIGSIM
jgi:hypothetical protein